MKKSWVKWLLATTAVLYTGLLVFITTAEWFFWDEFNPRFNFIAVDYLVWTQEVWGNIAESYPMAVIIPAIVLVAALIVFGFKNAGAFSFTDRPNTPARYRVFALAVLLIVPFLTFKFVNQAAIPNFTNQYETEIAKIGSWSFFAAFKQMELDYPRWYLKLPEKEALSATRKLPVTENEKAASDSPDDLSRVITPIGPEKDWNVILGCMESLSGEYMGYVDSDKYKDLTPHLDQLAETPYSSKTSTPPAPAPSAAWKPSRLAYPPHPVRRSSIAPRART